MVHSKMIRMIRHEYKKASITRICTPKQCQSGVAGIVGLLIFKHMLHGSLFLVPSLRVLPQFSQPLHTSKFLIDKSRCSETAKTN